MSRKKAFDIFLAVGDPSRRSSLWRVWGTPKGDVCLTTSEVQSDFKLTLHPPTESHPASRADLDRYLEFYNRERAHQGYRTKGRTPYQAFVEGAAAMRGETEVTPEAA